MNGEKNKVFPFINVYISVPNQYVCKDVLHYFLIHILIIVSIQPICMHKECWYDRKIKGSQCVQMDLYDYMIFTVYRFPFHGIGLDWVTY